MYPFNKITQGLIRFRDLLDFQIVSVIDFVFHSDDDAGAIIEGQGANIPIYSSIAKGLDQVDTLILSDPGTYFGGNQGVMEEHDLVTLWRDLVLAASARQIQVVSVHEIYDEATLNWINTNRVQINVNYSFSHSLLTEIDHKYDTSGTRIENYLKQFKNEEKMFAATKSIKRIGVFATRGCIGKFTTQMNLYREFKKSGIEIGALITEPTGFLFNQPEGDIFKFLAHRPLEKYPYYIDAVVHESEQNGLDWIIMAGQSSILPTSNIVFNSVRFAMLKAFHPNYNLLIVGYDDDDQIEEAIQMLTIYSIRPMALLLPDKIEISYGQYKIFSREIREKRKEKLREKFDVQVEFIENMAKIKEMLLEYDLASDQREYVGF